MHNDKKACILEVTWKKQLTEARQQSEDQITICCSQDNNESFFVRNDPRVTHEHGTNFNLSNDILQNIFTIKQYDYFQSRFFKTNGVIHLV